VAEVVATEELFWRLFTLYLMGALLLGGVASFILWYLAFRYKARSPEDVPPDAPRPGLIPSALLRTPSWSKLMLVSTGVIVTGLTLYSFIPLDYLSQTPVVQSPSLDGGGDKLVVWVEARQFVWVFKYPQGFTSVNKLVLPTDTLVEFKVTSNDVWHAFGIPYFKVKIDAIPGVVNSVWIKTPSKPGSYGYVWCYELCGAGHTIMRASVEVVDRGSFEGWVKSMGGG
jgi:cytochrome c oxidase subunit 2